MNALNQVDLKTEACYTTKMIASDEYFNFTNHPHNWIYRSMIVIKHDEAHTYTGVQDISPIDYILYENHISAYPSAPFTDIDWLKSQHG